MVTHKETYFPAFILLVLECSHPATLSWLSLTLSRICYGGLRRRQPVSILFLSHGQRRMLLGITYLPAPAEVCPTWKHSSSEAALRHPPPAACWRQDSNKGLAIYVKSGAIQSYIRHGCRKCGKDKSSLLGMNEPLRD